ncbi:putative F-box/LRR-repeat protein [Trifolium repens]|jgi:hypothetical protein|nr:putative F-box/LRR-repeat protein [Trifolium repens]
MEAKRRRTNPNWLQLQMDITSNILFRLDIIEILNTARNVCPLWWNIYKNPLMWKTIRMENFDLVNLPDNDDQVCDYLVNIFAMLLI